ncbi:SPLICING FACTOR 3B SUBUNIT 3 [Salix viminalis]|uniref:SPLICING FACTOR 3B SUBUNIT 3 n=1 Tax=Salix viminalis TaxID=40686 RepID=A0A9Q0TYX4_SALVM|nr:SPLICING FACTOR 3B SUBUNIT 3 [Salix viminalis]
MIGACEKQKLVYVLNRDNVARLTISSPLEAHKSHTICYSVCDQDSTGQATSEAQKNLTFYELDLGLNHVSRKWSEQVDNGANMLAMVPGGGDGPSGVLVRVENFVIYKNQGHPEICLLNTEYGDIFKVTLDHETDEVKELKIKPSGEEEEDVEASSATLLETEEGFQPVFLPAKRTTIVKVGSNRLTVVIALSGGELKYFEVDITGQLMEVEKHEMSGDVACLGIAPVLEGRQRSRFLAVGFV